MLCDNVACRDYRNHRTALFDGIEEGGIRASPYGSHEIDEHDNERAMDGLQDRVNILKRVSYSIKTLSIIALSLGMPLHYSKKTV